MAYKSNFNPDALPMHAEPDQAAQMIASSQRPHSNSSPHPASKPASTSPRPDYNKPAPPLPSQQSYRRPSNPPQNPSYSQSAAHPPPQGGYGPPQPSAYNTYSNAHTPVPVSGGYGQGYGPGRATSPRPPGAFPPPTPAPLLQSQASYGLAPQPGGAPGPAPSPGLGLGAGPGAGHGPPGDSSLFSLFRAVDTRGTGQLSEEQLGKALRNGDYTSFDPVTVRMMIRMFDHDRSGTVGFDEFQGLWGFLAAWRHLFDRFDDDRSGNISYNEYSNALEAFGYHLSPNFITTMYRLYDRPGPNAMSFDLFVQSCISLKRMTDMFKKYDTDRDGYITLSFEDFLSEILNQKN